MAMSCIRSPGLGITFSALSGATNDNSFTRYTSWVSLLNGDGNVVGSGGDDFDLEVGSGGTATIDGNAGNDRVYVWHQKNIVYDGGAGVDTISFNTATGDTYPIAYTQRLVIDLLTDTGQKNPYGGTLSLTNVENIVGTDNQTLADDITGDNNANVIGDGVYDTGHDTIHALGGNDRVELAEGAFGDNGGIHADGGDGVDTLAVNMGSWSSSGSNKLDLTNQANNTGVFHSDVLTNFEVFAHGSGFYGPSGQTFIFIDTNDGHVVETIGQTSNLTLNGGNDVAIFRWVTSSHSVHANGGAGMDTLNFEVDFFASSNILDLLHPANNSGTFANSTFTGFERFVHVEADGLNTATQRFTFRGNANAQTVLGALGIDDIRTAGGNDVLNGGLGKDVLGGGAGRDTFIFNRRSGRPISIGFRLLRARRHDQARERNLRRDRRQRTPRRDPLPRRSACSRRQRSHHLQSEHRRAALRLQRNRGRPRLSSRRWPRLPSTRISRTACARHPSAAMTPAATMPHRLSRQRLRRTTGLPRLRQATTASSSERFAEPSETSRIGRRRARPRRGGGTHRLATV